MTICLEDKKLKVGSLWPKVEAQLLSCKTGLPIADMDTVTEVFFIMMGDVEGERTEIINASASIDSVENATVSYTFGTGQTDTPGRYHGYFKVTHGASTPEIFPPDGSIAIKINEL